MDAGRIVDAIAVHSGDSAGVHPGLLAKGDFRNVFSDNAIFHESD